MTVFGSISRGPLTQAQLNPSSLNLDIPSIFLVRSVQVQCSPLAALVSNRAVVSDEMWAQAPTRLAKWPTRPTAWKVFTVLKLNMWCMSECRWENFPWSSYLHWEHPWMGPTETMQGLYSHSTADTCIYMMRTAPNKLAPRASLWNMIMIIISF